MEKECEKFGTEFKILFEVSYSELEEIFFLSKIAEGIVRIRERNVFIEPGYDGVYGKSKFFLKNKNSFPPKTPVLRKNL